MTLYTTYFNFHLVYYVDKLAPIYLLIQSFMAGENLAGQE